MCVRVYDTGFGAIAQIFALGEGFARWLDVGVVGREGVSVASRFL